MPLSLLATAEGEPLILTIDRVDLVAHDAATMTLKWTTTFERALLAVVYAAPNALPGDTRASPWRSSASSTIAIVVDDEGKLHVIDSATGKVLDALGSFGKPIALAASGANVAPRPPPPPCDLSCEVTRLRFVERQCMTKPCTDEAKKAVAALEEGRCADVAASLQVLRDNAEPNAKGAINEAQSGLTTACAPKP